MLAPQPDEVGSRAYQLLRGCTLGGFLVVLALGGHLAGGGRFVPGAFLATLVLGHLAVGAALARRRIRAGWAALFAAGSQLLSHAVLGLATTAAGLSAGGDPHPHATHVMSAAAAPAPLAGPDARMTAGHVVAGVALGLVIARVDALLHALLRPVLRVLVLLGWARPSLPGPTCTSWVAPGSLRCRAVSIRPGRGPPLAAPAAA